MAVLNIEVKAIVRSQAGSAIRLSRSFTTISSASSRALSAIVSCARKGLILQIASTTCCPESALARLP